MLDVLRRYELPAHGWGHQGRVPKIWNLGLRPQVIRVQMDRRLVLKAGLAASLVSSVEFLIAPLVIITGGIAVFAPE